MDCFSGESCREVQKKKCVQITSVRYAPQQRAGEVGSQSHCVLPRPNPSDPPHHLPPCSRQAGQQQGIALSLWAATLVAQSGNRHADRSWVIVGMPDSRL